MGMTASAAGHSGPHCGTIVRFGRLGVSWLGHFKILRKHRGHFSTILRTPLHFSTKPPLDVSNPNPLQSPVFSCKQIFNLYNTNVSWMNDRWGGTGRLLPHKAEATEWTN